MSNVQGAAEHNGSGNILACVQLNHAAVVLNRVPQSFGGQSQSGRDILSARLQCLSSSKAALKPHQSVT